MNRREALKRTATITGLAISSSITLSILESCQPKGEINWQPQFLSEEEARLVAAISETILPESDTPGASELHLYEFIDMMLKDTFSEDVQKKFKEGLAAFSATTNKDYSKPFEKCSQNQKTEIIQAEETRSYEQLSQTKQRSAYLTIKQLTLLGFFTSECVMTNLLNYNPVPTRYDGCITIDENEKLYVGN